MAHGGNRLHVAAELHTRLLKANHLSKGTVVRIMRNQQYGALKN